MILIRNIKVKADEELSLNRIVSGFLSVPEDEISNISIKKKSIDARKKPEIYFQYSFWVQLKHPGLEKKLVAKKKAEWIQEKHQYRLPESGEMKLNHSPVIVGAGPAGLFAAYILAQKGYRPIVIERGQEIRERSKTVKEYWNGAKLNPDSNVQFGEGGAGTFSDGKLNTGVKDKTGRNRYVLETFVKHGAPKQILYDALPHIGTDILSDVIVNLRNEILSLGASFRFQTRLEQLIFENDTLSGIIISTKEGLKETLPCECLILAIGHSARDTYEMLYQNAVSMEPKPFAVGLRVAHTQEDINRIQYGEDYRNRYPSLPASPYKLCCQTANGRNVYSFCMCPGGYIVDASSEEGRIAVNGMSDSKRDGEFANSAIIVSVTPKDFDNGTPLGGMYFQRELEEKAFKAGNGAVPVCFYSEFYNRIMNKQMPLPEMNRLNHPFMKGNFHKSDLTAIFPEAISKSFIEGMEIFGSVMKGFNSKDAILAAVESRTSAPVRIIRNDSYESVSHKGIYPCGEGCGYAGGIMSAGMDGLKVGEAIIGKYRQFE